MSAMGEIYGEMVDRLGLDPEADSTWAIVENEAERKSPMYMAVVNEFLAERDARETAAREAEETRADNRFMAGLVVGTVAWLGVLVAVGAVAI